MAARAKSVKFVTLVSGQSSELLNAAELVSALLRTSTCSSLSELYQRMGAGDEAVLSRMEPVRLSEDQLVAIERFSTELSLLRVSPTVSLSECPVCGQVSAVAGAALRRCLLTLGCEGVPVKSGFAKKQPVEAVPAVVDAAA